MKNTNPENTPFWRYVRKLEKQGVPRGEAISQATRNWPNTREIVCYIYSRAHRSAFIELAKALIKRGIAIDYEYRSKKEMVGEIGDPTAEPRGGITMTDRSTPLPDDLLEEIGKKYDVRWDCYDDEYLGYESNPKRNLKAKLLR